jgi:hypothetical protein
MWALVAAILVAVPWAGCQLYIRSHHLSFVPYGIAASNILYVEEKQWGIGLPGDNETGVLVYEMPEAVAEGLEAGGVGYLEQLPRKPQSPPPDFRGVYSDWQETPVVPDPRHWGSSDYEGTRYWVSPGIGDYLNKYGFPIPIDASIEAMINDAISKSGGYYAYGRIGMILLIPRVRRIVYAYNG